MTARKRRAFDAWNHAEGAARRHDGGTGVAGADERVGVARGDEFGGHADGGARAGGAAPAPRARRSRPSPRRPRLRARRCSRRRADGARTSRGASGPTRSTRTSRWRAAASAPSTTTAGAWSPPMASTAMRSMIRQCPAAARPRSTAGPRGWRSPRLTIRRQRRRGPAGRDSSRSSSTHDAAP